MSYNYKESFHTSSPVKKSSLRPYKREKDVNTEGAESNIKVYARCRRRNERELKENSEVSVTTRGDGGREIMVYSGLMNIGKSYSYDQVFGAEADQEMVYKNVASDMLDDMLAGYNCTIFAYGETGTGKTHTMIGDLSETDNGVIPKNAGIIPRVMNDLFRDLSKSSGEYSVKISYIELYNEELKDLMTPDESRKLRIYDDKTGKKPKVLVQNMEETFIESANEGLKLLQEGSYRRKVISTKSNDVSSRSHSLFTITVMIREVTKSGDEHLRIGKLNLVDLAGSENISRSGSVQTRAIEAGKINQSLLTLGRVINSLVERSPHIPYRESKLTRLLQDSLGGTTKTCIIATISPTKTSLDETSNTLEFANRAKKVKNKPHINQTISKKAIINEYIQEIKGLRADIQASRLRQGVYLLPERYQELLDESESQRVLVEEQTLQINAIESQLETLKENYQNSQNELVAVIEDLANATASLENERANSGAVQSELARMKYQAYSEREFLLRKILELRRQSSNESLIREEMEIVQTKLQKQGSELISTLNMTVLDMESLNDRVIQKSLLEKVNLDTFTTINATVSNACDNIRANFESFHDEIAKATSATLSALKEAGVMESKKLDAKENCIIDRISSFDTFKNTACHDLRETESSMDNHITSIRSKMGHLGTIITAHFETLGKSSINNCNTILKHLKSFQESIHKDNQNLAQTIHHTFTDLQIKLEYQNKELEKIRENGSRSDQDISLNIEDHAERIESLVESEMKSNRNAQEQALEQFNSILRQMWETQDAKLTSRIIEHKDSLYQTHSKIQQASNGHTSALYDLDKINKELQFEMKERHRSLRSSLNVISAAIKDRRKGIHKITRESHEDIITSVDSYITDINQQRTAFDDKIAKLRETALTSSSRMKNCLDGFAENNRESHLALNLTMSELNTMSDGLEQAVKKNVGDFKMKSSKLGERQSQVIDNIQTVIKHEFRQDMHADLKINLADAKSRCSTHKESLFKPRDRDTILSSIDPAKQSELTRQEQELLKDLLSRLYINGDERLQLRQAIIDHPDLDEKENQAFVLETNDNRPPAIVTDRL